MPTASSLTDLVEQPAKVMRIGTMIKQLLEEVRAAPLDDASRNRLRNPPTSIRELEDGLAPELRDELERLTLPFTEDAVPSDAEPDRAGAAGRLAGGAPRHPDRAVRPADGGPPQLEQMRQGALPPGAGVPGQRGGRRTPGPGSTCRRPWPAPLPIETRNAWVEFPIFDAKTRSLKKAFLGKAGGTIGRNASNVVVIEALRDITMSLELGDRVGWSGTTAPGKSTLLRGCCPGSTNPPAGRRR